MKDKEPSFLFDPNMEVTKEPAVLPELEESNSEFLFVPEDKETEQPKTVQEERISELEEKGVQIINDELDFTSENGEKAYTNALLILEEFGAEAATKFLSTETCYYINLSKEAVKHWFFELVKTSSYFLRAEKKVLQTAVHLNLADGLDESAEEIRRQKESLSFVESSLKQRGENIYAYALLNVTDRFVAKIEQSDLSIELKTLAFDIGSAYFKNPDRIDDVLTFIQENIPEDCLNAGAPNEMKSFLRCRVTFLETLKNSITSEKWNSLFDNMENLDELNKLYQYSRNSENQPIFKKGVLNWFDLRNIKYNIIETDDEEMNQRLSSLLEQVKDVLSASQIDVLAQSVSNDIKTAVLNSDYKKEFRYYYCAGKFGNIEIGIRFDSQHELIPSILHEIGHGVMARVNSSKEGRELFELYNVATALEPQKHSSYAHKFSIEKNRKN